MPGDATRPFRPGVIAAIFAGGTVGALLRGGMASQWPTGAGGWPWSTLTANLVGTAVLAVLAATVTARNDPGRVWRALLGTGFCGALTTFSALQVEVITLAKDGDLMLARSAPEDDANAQFLH